MNKKNLCFRLMLVLGSIFAFPLKVLAASRSTDKGFIEALNNLYAESSFIFTAIIGVSILTCAAVIIILLVRLSNSGSNPSERKDIIKELLVVFVCLGLFGAVPLIFALLRNLVQIQ